MAARANATLRMARISPRKMRIVADMIRGQRVDAAMGLLTHLPKKSGAVLKKLLVSAVANAENNEKADVDQLVVHAITIDNGPIMKRWMPRAMGRANRVQRRTSHVTITVAEKE